DGHIGSEAVTRYSDGMELEGAHARVPRRPSGVLLSTLRQVGADDVRGGSAHRYRSLPQPNRALTEAADSTHVVTDDDDGPPLPAHVAHLAETLLLECGIADGQYLVHQQDLRLQMRRHGEC